MISLEKKNSLPIESQKRGGGGIPLQKKEARLIASGEGGVTGQHDFQSSRFSQGGGGCAPFTEKVVLEKRGHC